MGKMIKKKNVPWNVIKLNKGIASENLPKFGI
jgi:hypothetical protein